MEVVVMRQVPHCNIHHAVQDAAVRVVEEAMVHVKQGCREKAVGPELTFVNFFADHPGSVFHL